MPEKQSIFHMIHDNSHVRSPVKSNTTLEQQVILKRHSQEKVHRPSSIHDQLRSTLKQHKRYSQETQSREKQPILHTRSIEKHIGTTGYPQETQSRDSPLSIRYTKIPIQDHQSNRVPHWNNRLSSSFKNYSAISECGAG
jgi:hypothetical protein